MAPLALLSPQAVGPQTWLSYWKLLRDIPERWLCAAVVEHCQTSEERWLPAPAVLRRLARTAEFSDWQRRVEAAPACGLCEDGRVYLFGGGYCACGCVRGEPYRNMGATVFDPRTMLSDRQEQRRIVAERTKGLPAPTITAAQAAAAIGNIPAQPARRWWGSRKRALPAPSEQVQAGPASARSEP